MSPALSKSLIDILLASGVPSRDEAVALAANLNGGSWTAEVLDSGKVDEQLFLEAIGDFFRSRSSRSTRKASSARPCSLLPSRFVFQHHILPIEIKDNAVVLATYDLFNSVGRQLASQLLDKPAEWVLVPRAQLLRAMKTLYGVGAETFDEILKTNRSFEARRTSKRAPTSTRTIPRRRVVKFVNQIIREAILERATDIHVEPLENDLRIRYRIDGILHEVAVPPQLRVLQSAIISRLKVMAHMDIAERRLPQDGRINLQSHDQNIDVRVSTIPTVNGESISLRLLSRDQQQAFGFERLDMSQKQTADHESARSRSRTASSSSPARPAPANRRRSTASSAASTRSSAASSRSRNRWNIGLPGVSQIDVKPEIDLTFANGLRHILRQDPNVVMVGEIRDFETAEIAIRAAMTGHLVFTTLHTNDAVGGITRLLDMGIEPSSSPPSSRPSSPSASCAPICPDCIETGRLSEGIPRGDRFPARDGDDASSSGAGCENCRQTGYQGRLAIYEICVVTEPLKRLIMQKRDGGELKQCAIAEGMETLRQDGWRRVAGRQNDDRRSRPRHADRRSDGGDDRLRRACRGALVIAFGAVAIA